MLVHVLESLKKLHKSFTTLSSLKNFLLKPKKAAEDLVKTGISQVINALDQGNAQDVFAQLNTSNKSVQNQTAITQSQYQERTCHRYS